MRLTLRAKWVNLCLTLGPDADREDEPAAYVGSNSADLSVAPAYDEGYYYEEEEDYAGFGFVKPRAPEQV